MNGELGKARLGLMELGVIEDDVETIDLLIESAEQQQNADQPQLTFASVLAVADAVQEQLADAVQLAFVVPLLIEDATQAQTADEVQLAGTSVLIIADATQEQRADSVVFDNPTFVLNIANGVQMQLAQAPVLIGPPSDLPALPDYCWPVDTSCCDGWDDYPADVQARATALAGQTMRMLTGWQVGGCPITVRPCKATDCHGQTWAAYAVGSDPGYGGFVPTNLGDRWLNVACCSAGRDCACSKVCEISLPGPVGPISEVRIDGEVVDPTTYRVDNGSVLVRQGGECWPACQDMSAPAGAEGSFTVTYLQGIPVDGLGAYAGGVLACEFARACTGGDCRLPTQAVSVARQGVNITLQPTTFANGTTGIPEVDAEIQRWNPNRLKGPARILVPGRRPVRRTTWDGGL